MWIDVCACGPLATNTYVIGCPSTRKAVIIDPSFESLTFIENTLQAKQLMPEAVWLTHSHLDHIGNLAEVKERYRIPVFLHPSDKDNVEHPGSDGIPLFVPTTPSSVDHFLQDRELIFCGALAFEVLHTPGHTPGGVCFYEEKHKVLFSGDTLFQGTIGSLRFPTADPDAMWRSLKKLATLPPETKVYPGHGKPTTIGEEKFLCDPESYFAS